MQADYLHVTNCLSIMIQFDTWLLVGSTLRRNTALPDSYHLKTSDNKNRGYFCFFLVLFTLCYFMSVILLMFEEERAVSGPSGFVSIESSHAITCPILTPKDI